MACAMLVVQRSRLHSILELLCENDNPIIVGKAMTGTEDRIAELEKQVAELTKLCEKQSQMVAKTGEQVLSMQMKELKVRMNESDGKSTGSNVDMSDYVTNEDIVQLVGEMQQQFDLIEERNIQRIANSRLGDSGFGSSITPLTNKDGEYPPEDVVPQTVEDFTKMSKFDIVRLAEFYELVIPQSERDGIQQFIGASSGEMDVEQAKKLLFESKSASADLSHRVESYTTTEIEKLSKDIARYMGLSTVLRS